MVAILGQDCSLVIQPFLDFPPFLLTHPCVNLSGTPLLLSSVLLQKMAAPLQMLRTSTQEFTDPTPPVLAPAMELRLFVALSPVQFAMLTDRRPILPDPYSLRFGLRSDPLKAFERAHYFMSWSAPYAEPPPRESIKKYMLCTIVFTPQGVLTLLLANILEKGDGTDPNRAGYFRIRGPLFHELRGSDANQTLFYRFENQYSELI